MYYSLRNFKTYFENKYDKYSDSQVGVQIIKKNGATKSSICNDIVKIIWLFCVKNKISITEAQIPGAENVIANYESRKSYKNAEWMLNPEIIQKTTKQLKFKPNLDCFTSRLSTAIYKPEPDAYLIDGFSFHWGFYKCFLFPPFSLIDRTLQNICVDQTEVLLVVPKWRTQPWYNSFQGMLSQEPYVVSKQKENILLL